MLSLGDSISQMLSSDGTAVRHTQLTGTLSPATRWPFSKQGIVVSGAISFSEDRLRLRCGPLQMPRENTEILMEGNIEGEIVVIYRPHSAPDSREGKTIQQLHTCCTPMQAVG